MVGPSGGGHIKLRITPKQAAVAAIVVAEIALLLLIVFLPGAAPTGSLVVRAGAASIHVNEQGGPWQDLVVQRVVAPVPSWLVVQAERGGQPGQVLGYTAVPAGQTFDVVVDLSSAPIMPNTLLVSLLADRGRRGVFEYSPGSAGGGGGMGMGGGTSAPKTTAAAPADNPDKPLVTSGRPVSVEVVETYRDASQAVRRIVLPQGR